MVPEAASCMAKEGNVVAQSCCKSLSDKKNQGRIPEKIHKAEREKLKRDQMNKLFSELCHAVEPSQQNNGKACMLGDATKLLRDLIAQVESLRKENAALLTESHYVTVEKNEFGDENTVLTTEIEKLQCELQEKGKLNLQGAAMENHINSPYPSSHTRHCLCSNHPLLAHFMSSPSNKISTPAMKKPLP